MKQPSDLLRDREADGLTLFIALEIVGLVVLAVGIILFVERANLAAVAGFAALVVASAGGLLVMVRRRRNMALAGHCAIAIAFLGTGPIVFAEWQGIGVDAHAASYLVKTGFPVGLVLVALSGLTLRPHYPASTTVLLVLFQLCLLAVALDDPRTVLARAATWEEDVMGDALHLGRLANHLVFTAATGAVITFVTWIARRTVLSAVRLEKANGQLRRYFSPEIAERVATADPEFLKPGGSRRFVVVLVSDIGGFTSLSAALGPDATMHLLADYQKRMTEAIFRHGGSVDKFVGDGILATFGAVAAAASPCRQAALAASAMMGALDALNAERAVAGATAIAQRIGVHAGEAMVGNVGSEDRLEFTVIGDVVNVASRIEQACKRTGDPVLLSRAVVEACPDLVVVARGRPELPGVTEPPELFALSRPAEPVSA